MHSDWEDWRVFLAVAETGSMSGAAKRLGVKQPTVSRRLQFLEGELGTALFHRSVGGAHLTAAGEKLVPSAKKMAEWAAELERTAAASDAKPEGLVRVTAPPGVAYDFLAPFAGWLAVKHPRLRLEVLTSISYLDLNRGEADLALRFRPSPELLEVASVKVDVAVHVSKGYAKQLGKRPRLDALRWISWSPPYEDVPPAPQLRALIPNFTPAFTADDYVVQVQAACAGVGAVAIGRQRSRHAFPRPLVPLDVPLGPHATSRLHLVCTKRALEIPRVRAVAELLTDELAHVVTH